MWTFGAFDGTGRQTKFMIRGSATVPGAVPGAWESTCQIWGESAASTNDPVISTKGVVGRIVRPGAHFSSVLLLSDPTSRIPVLTSEGRVPAIVQGRGFGAFLEVKFIPRNDEVSPGEILITSGQGGVFPKGIPVARVVEVTPADVSLFQNVYAEPLLALRYYEELLILSRRNEIPSETGSNATSEEGNATQDSDNASAAKKNSNGTSAPDAQATDGSGVRQKARKKR